MGSEGGSVLDRVRRWLAPLPAPVRRPLVLLVGGTVVLIGVALLVLPGPGILVIIIGLAILATEFAWAEMLLVQARKRAAAAAERVRRTVRGDGQ